MDKTSETDGDLVEFYHSVRDETGLDFRPVPIREDTKKPAVPEWKSWQHENCPPEEYEEKLKAHRSHEGNVALIPPPGTIVIDFDRKRGIDGVNNFKTTCEEQGIDTNYLKDAPCVRTPSGGFHYYVRDSNSELTKKQTGYLEGVDLQVGESGCYVLIPPSSTETGDYTWERNLLTQPVPKMTDFPEPEASSDRNESSDRREQKANGTIPKGQRNDTLTRVAGKLRRHGLEQDEIFATLTKLNEKRCQSPLPEQEVKKIAESVARYPAEDDEFEREAWPDPIRPDAPPEAEPFPTHVLPEPAAGWVRRKARSVDCPEAFPATVVLGVMGVGIGGTHEIQIKQDWTEGTNLNLLNVGPPGCGKSPSSKSAVRPLKSHHQDLKEISQDLQDDYDDRLDEYQRLKLAEQDEEEIPKPDEPRSWRLLVTDTTVEALAESLADNPRGLCLYQDEAASWTRSVNQYKSGRGTERQFYLSCWSREIHEGMRKTTSNASVARPHLAVIGNLVPEVVEDLTDEAGRDDGFVHRILFCYPGAKVTLITEVEVDQEVQGVYRSFIEKLLALDPVDQPTLNDDFQWEGEWEPQKVSLEPEAKKEIQGWYNETIAPRCEDNPRMRGPFTKAKSHVYRLALILHIGHMVSDRTENDIGSVREPISEKAAENAIILMEFFLNHIERVYGELHEQTGEGGFESKEAYVLERILKKLENQDDEANRIPYRDVQQATKDKKGINASVLKDEIIPFLEQNHCIKLEKISTGGRPKKIVVVNPKLLDDTPETPSRNSQKPPVNGDGPSGSERNSEEALDLQEGVI